MNETVERIKILEGSKDIMKKRLLRLFTKVEELDGKMKDMEISEDDFDRTITALQQKIDSLTGRLVETENALKVLSENSHTHKIVM